MNTKKDLHILFTKLKAVKLLESEKKDIEEAILLNHDLKIDDACKEAKPHSVKNLQYH